MSPSKVCWDWMIKDMTYLFRQWLSFEETIACVTKAKCRVSLFQRNSSDNCREWKIWSQHNCILFCCWPRCLLFSLSSQFSVLPKTSSGIKYFILCTSFPTQTRQDLPQPGRAVQICDSRYERRVASSSKWILIVFKMPTICLAAKTSFHPEGHLAWQAFSHLWIGEPLVYLFIYFFN